MVRITKSPAAKLQATASIAAALAVLWLNAAWAAPRADVIESPGHTGKIYLESTDLIAAGSGWLYRLPLVLNASDPLLEVEVAGDSLSVPYQSHLELRPGILLHEGENLVRVRAFTDVRVHERTFAIHVEPLDPISSLPRNTVNSQRILIFRPVEHGADVLLPDELLEAGGGAAALYDPALGQRVRGALYFEFVVEVSAFSPIREIKIDGQLAAQPHNTWARAKAPVEIGAQGAVVEVEASTDLATHTERFTIGLAATSLPGTHFYLANPPGYTKPAPPAAEPLDGEAK